MGNVLVKEETLTQIADAIREKSGSSDSYRPGEMPEAILEISTYSGEGADPNKPIRFFGPYGDLVYSYTFAEISELTELPPLPEYKGLVGQEWNWSLENILAEESELEIASMYITDDGATRIYVTLDEETLSPKVGFIQEKANSVWIDWGDGNPMESSDVYGTSNLVSVEHSYEKPGNYVIRLVPDEGAKFWLEGSTNGTCILHKIARGSLENMIFSNSIYKVELGRGITSLREGCFCSYTIKTVTIPKEISDFGRGFQKCYALEYLAFPKNVDNLTSSAFDGSCSLKRVVFSDTLLSLAQYTFYNCTQLEHIVLSSKVKVHGAYTFVGNKRIEKLDLSKQSTEIGESSFYDCSNLKEVIMKKTLWKIGQSAFRSCDMLQKIELPDTVNQIESYAFGDCPSLRKINLPEGIMTIPSSLFYGCYSLQEIKIPSTVTKIEGYVFNKCYGLQRYYLYPTVPPTLSRSLDLAATEGIVIYVPKGCLEAYQTAEYWSNYAEHMVEMED